MRRDMRNRAGKSGQTLAALPNHNSTPTHTHTPLGPGSQPTFCRQGITGAVIQEGEGILRSDCRPTLKPLTDPLEPGQDGSRPVMGATEAMLRDRRTPLGGIPEI